MPMANGKPGFRLKRGQSTERGRGGQFRPLFAATVTNNFDNVRIEDDLTFRLSQTEDQRSSDDEYREDDTNSFIGSIKSKNKWPTLVPI